MIPKEKEAELLEQTDNGWQEGDPEDQPENPDPWSYGSEQEEIEDAIS